MFNDRDKFFSQRCERGSRVGEETGIYGEKIAVSLARHGSFSSLYLTVEINVPSGRCKRGRLRRKWNYVSREKEIRNVETNFDVPSVIRFLFVHGVQW